MIIKAMLKKYVLVASRHISQSKLWKWNWGVMSPKIVTVNIDILTANTFMCHYNPHESYKLLILTYLLHY